MKRLSILALSAFFLFSLAAISAEAQTGRYWRGDRGRQASWSRRTIVRPVRIVRYGFPTQRYYSSYPREYRAYPRSYRSYPPYGRYSTYTPYYNRSYTRYRRPLRSGLSVRLGW